MGRSKPVQSAHRKSSTSNVKSYPGKLMQARRSLVPVVSEDDVNEATLKVWRTLPSKIRQDPSLAPFQLENERVSGSESVLLFLLGILFL